MQSESWNLFKCPQLESWNQNVRSNRIAKQSPGNLYCTQPIEILDRFALGPLQLKQFCLSVGMGVCNCRRSFIDAPGNTLYYWARLQLYWATLVNTGQLWAILGQSGKADAALNSRPLKTLPTISGKIQPVSAAGFLSNQTAETNFRLRLCFLNLHFCFLLFSPPDPPH